VLSQPRSTQRRKEHVPSDEPRLLKRIVELASEYGRYGYRRVTALLRREGWTVNHKRVERLWRLFGKNPKDQDVFLLPTASARPNGYRTPSRPSFSWRAQKTTGIAFTTKTIARYKNGYIESFNGKLRDELLAREQFDTLLEAKVLIERWRRHFNAIRPHNSLGYRAPAPEAIQLASLTSATPQRAKKAGVGTGPTLS
jgi:transposase InsO family protein